jgi:hypothetical protein
VIIAVCILLYGVFTAHTTTLDAQNRNRQSWEEDTRIWNALRCAGQFLGKDMTAFTNQYGNIDIGRAGCASKSFLANFEEVREALRSPPPQPRPFSYWESFLELAAIWLFFAVIALLGVNALGFALIGALAIVRWVLKGFQSA